MAQFNVILNQVVILGILVVIGYAAAKLKVITPVFKDGIGKLIIRITMPALILTSVSNLNITGGMLRSGIAVMVFTYLFLLVLFALALLSSKVLRLKNATRDVYLALSMFGNVIFLGFPLFKALYPETGLFYAIFFYLASDSLVWTLGIYLMGRGGNTGKSPAAGLKHLVNPSTIAFTAGFIMFAVKLRLPDLIGTPLGLLGQTTTPLSMLFIGATLAGIALRGVYKKYSIFILAFLKMLAVPTMALFTVKFLNGALALGMDDAAITVLILQIAMPCMTIFAVISKEMGSDGEYAAECIFVTTVLSIATLPGMFYLVELVNKI